MKKLKYPFEIQMLDESEGGGYLITFPDLPGCMSDGETIEEAIENGKDAVNCWIQTAKEFDDPVPKPGRGSLSGRFVQRVPKSLHTRLASRAKQEGVSMNALTTYFLVEGLTSNENRTKPKPAKPKQIKTTRTIPTLKRKKPKAARKRA